MMNKPTLTVYQDDSSEDILERLQFVLNEIGINMETDHSDYECIVYSFTRAERLGDATEEA